MRTSTDFVTWFLQINGGDDLGLLKRFFNYIEVINYGEALSEFFDAYDELNLQGHHETVVASACLGVAQKQLIDALRLQGFEVDPSVLLGEALDICEGIQQHLQMEDKIMARRLLESYPNDKELFLEFMRECSVIEVETLACLVLRVPILYREIMEERYPYVEYEQNEPNEQGDLKMYYDVYTKYKASPSGIIARYADNVAEFATGVGMPLMTLLGLFQNTQAYATCIEGGEDGMDDMAAEIYGLVILSGDYHLNPLAGCQWACIQIYPDIEQRRQVELKCRNVFREVCNA